MLDIHWIHDPNAWIALGTLTVMEIVLGIDNIIFIAVLAGKLPEEKRDTARKLGLLIAMGTRILLLFSISWLLKLVGPLFSIFDHSISGKDLILIGGGLFLLWKATREIHDKIEGDEQKEKGSSCHLYPSDAADDLHCVDPGSRRDNKHKTNEDKRAE